jgi:hypothetical protein
MAAKVKDGQSLPESQGAEGGAFCSPTSDFMQLLDRK